MLQATLSKSMKVTVGVGRVKLRGRLHVLLSPLSHDLPVVTAIQFGFTNPPDIELTYTGAAGGILNVAQSTLLGVIDSCLAGVLVLPNRMTMPMDLGRYDYLETYVPPVGVIRLRALRGRGFTLLRGLLLNDIPDVYCTLRLGASDAHRTSTRVDDLSPNWEDEDGFDYVLYDMDQKVYVDVYDEDVANADELLGRAEITCRELFGGEGGGDDDDDDGIDGGGHTRELELALDGERTGCYLTVNAELYRLTDRLSSFDMPEYDGKDRMCGLMTIIVTRAYDLPIPRCDAATYVRVQYGGDGTPCKNRREFVTGTVTDYPGVDALNPMYDCAFHVPLTRAMLGTGRDTEGGVSSSPMSPASTSPPRSRGAIAAAADDCDDAGGGGGGSNRRRNSLLAMAGSVSTRMLETAGVPSRRANSRDDRRWNDVIFTLIDTDGANGTPGHGELGKVTVTHDELIRAYKHVITETRPIGDKGAKLEFRITLCGMQSEEEKLNLANAPKEIDDHLAPALYTSLFATKLSNAAHSRPVGGATIRVTALRGRGFVIKKRNLKKDDVPDTYCIIRTNACSEEWKTATIKDDCMPNWNETRDFPNVDPSRCKIFVDVYDKNGRKGKDDYIGSAKFPVQSLLRKRLMEVELFKGKTATNSYVTLTCVRLNTIKDVASGVGDVLIHYQPELGDDGVESTVIPPSHIPSRAKTANDIDDGSVASTRSDGNKLRRRKGIKNLPAKLLKKISPVAQRSPPEKEPSI
ncbi:hypothetical protein ACHAXA_000749 [Cyclostephanos tholiformis]|uniref:C2 domain-containing protein n=1 Tax=Cyclostephanos tholiformis TaxID=382380 RepID=A0ABD3RT42_9STRA